MKPTVADREGAFVLIMSIRRTRETPVSEALASAVRGMPSSVKIFESLAFVHWPKIVGAQAAAATEPESVRDGTLIVRTKSGVWSHEMSMMKAHLITELNLHIGKPVIKEIVFRAQGIKRKKSESTVSGQPTEADLKLLRLPAAEQVFLQNELDRLDSISDDRIRNSVSQRIVRERKLRWWRLQNGWKACSRCSAAHNTDGAVCPICRLTR